MINSNDRLDRIEAAFERMQQRMDAAFQRTQQQIDSNAKAITANSATIAEVDRTLSEAAGRTLRAIDALRERAEEYRVNFQEYFQRNDATTTSINAAVERLEAILTQLRRRDGDDGNQSSNSNRRAMPPPAAMTSSKLKEIQIYVYFPQSCQ